MKYRDITGCLDCGTDRRSKPKFDRSLPSQMATTFRMMRSVAPAIESKPDRKPPGPKPRDKKKRGQPRPVAAKSERTKQLEMQIIFDGDPYGTYWILQSISSEISPRLSDPKRGWPKTGGPLNGISLALENGITIKSGSGDAYVDAHPNSKDKIGYVNSGRIDLPFESTTFIGDDGNRVVFDEPGFDRGDSAETKKSQKEQEKIHRKTIEKLQRQLQEALDEAGVDEDLVGFIVSDQASAPCRPCIPLRARR